MKKMTREEMIKRIEKIKDHRFYLAMADRMTHEARQLDIQLMNEQINLERKLKEIN